jgi:hypothetical protein
MRLKRISLVSFVLFSCVISLTAQAEQREVDNLPKASVRFAILVGIEQYDDPNIATITGPANDVQRVKNALEKFADFSDDNIVVLSTADGYRKPTRDEILKSLSRIKNIVPENGLLLFMFSGHGISRGERGFLLPSSATLTGDQDLLEQTSLDVDLVRKEIAGTGVKQAILLIDACRDDPEASKGSGTNPLTNALTRGLDLTALNSQVEASVVIFATDLGHRAYVDSNLKLGYFTEAFTDGLGGKAADNKGNVTLGALLDYVQTTVPKMVSKDRGAKVEQKPFYILAGYQPSKLIFGHANSAPATAVIPAQPTPTTGPEVVPDPRSPKSGALDLSAEFEKNQGDELALAKLGEAAFDRGNYDWTIRFLEQAKKVESSRVWMYTYPFLAGAYLLGNGSEERFRQALNEMLAQMKFPNTYLHHAAPISFCLKNLSKVRALVPPSSAQFIDDVVQQVVEISSRLGNAERKAVISTCKFYGEANPGQNAFLKEQSCIIPDIDRLDKAYHQADFVCCGGGATSTTTASDIPAGIEIKTSGAVYWSVQSPTLTSDKFGVTTYCGPSGALGGSGCNVKTEIFAHYQY